MDGKILVVGGYGSVGRVICRELGGEFPGRVISAGRDFIKAEKFSAATGRQVLPLELDIYAAQACSCLDRGVKLVVMCLDQRDSKFAGECLRRGIHYVDISANIELLTEIASLAGEARQHGATAVLSVGLAPGLTNLLVSYCKSLFRDMRRADIFIMLGLGEAHGEAAIRWTVDNLNRSFAVCCHGRTLPVRCFEGRKITAFPGDTGRRSAYRFNFPEQMTLPKTLGLDSAATWLCFDSALITGALALSGKAGLFKMLHFPPLRELLVRLFKTCHFGSEDFAVKVEAQGLAGHSYIRRECALRGKGEARITGLVAAEVARCLGAGSQPAGVFHLEQLFEPVSFIEKLAGKGLEFLPARVEGQSRHFGNQTRK